MWRDVNEANRWVQSAQNSDGNNGNRSYARSSREADLVNEITNESDQKPIIVPPEEIEAPTKKKPNKSRKSKKDPKKKKKHDPDSSDSESSSSTSSSDGSDPSSSSDESSKSDTSSSEESK